MLNQWANMLADVICSHSSVEFSRRSIYVYGLELLLSTGFSVLFIILISAIFFLVHYSVTFLFVFISLRLFNGGYHAKTYGRCFLLTNTVFFAVLVATLLAQSVVPTSTYKVFYILVTIISSITIFALSPIKHVNHPLSEESYRRNRRIGRSLVLAISFVDYISLVYSLPVISPILVTFTLIAVAIMMIISKFTERRQ